MHLHSTRSTWSINWADLVQSEDLSCGIVEFVMVDLMGSKGSVEWQLDVGGEACKFEHSGRERREGLSWMMAAVSRHCLSNVLRSLMVTAQNTL